MALVKGMAIQPQLRDEIVLRDKAMAGDMAMVISPEAVTSDETSEAWTREVVIEIQDSNGNVHTWLNQSYATSLAIADTSVAGTASIESTTLTLERGRAVVVVSGDEEDWLDDETNTLTVSNITVMGYEITGGTSVETFDDGEE